MSHKDERPDHLQRFWQEDNDPIQKETLPMLMQLVQEKRRSYFEMVDGELNRYYKQALLLGGVSVYLAVRAPVFPARVGWGLMAIFCFSFALQTVLRRRRKVHPIPEQDGRAYCNELVEFYEQRIRDVQRSRRYAFPAAILMVVLVVWPYLGAWGSLFLGAGMILLWMLLGQKNTETAAELRRRQQEVVGLLNEMDRL